MKKNTLNVVRWVLLLPALTLGFIVADVLTTLISFINLSYPKDMIFLSTLNPIITTTVVLYLTTLTAPHHKKWVALTVVLLLLSLSSYILWGLFTSIKIYFYWGLLSLFWILLISGFFLYRFFKREKKKITE